MTVLLAAAIAFAGSDPCSKGATKMDPDTGAEIVEFKGADWKVRHSPEGTEYSASVFRAGHLSRTLEPGWNLDAKLADGSAVRFSLDEAAEPRATTNETGSWTRWETAFPVDDEDIKNLARSPISVVRMDLGGGPDLTEISRGRGKKVQTAFACIESLLP